LDDVGKSFVEDVLLLQHHLVDIVQDFSRIVLQMNFLQPDIRTQHLEQSGHPHPIEFVKIIGEDTQKTEAVIQVYLLVARLLQHAGIEGKPTDVTNDRLLFHRQAN
jgi:hypothetical protein